MLKRKEKVLLKTLNISRGLVNHSVGLPFVIPQVFLRSL